MFTKLPRIDWFVLCTIVLTGCGIATSPSSGTVQEGYFFCFWNLENFFDDKDDHRTQPGDREYDSWFAHDPEALRLKLAHVSEAILAMNDGRGPDILAVVEVESVRAAELLRDALNQRMRDPALAYTHVLMKDLEAGRHIAPAIITRLPVEKDKTHLHGRRQRILEGHIDVNGNDLVILATHWTSRLTDKEGRHRADYGDQIYGRFHAMYRGNPAVDVLVCGDFNDPPDAPSVTEHLHATGNAAKVRQPGGEPYLLDLMAGKEPELFGTHYYNGRWSIFDQIAVSPGMLDDHGWSCDTASVKTVNSLTRPDDRHHRPWRFGGERDKAKRGYSDHFPVTIRLRTH